MKRKGKKTFRGLPSQHKVAAKSAAKSMRQEVSRSVQASKRGDCEKALFFLENAAHRFGAQDANLRDSNIGVIAFDRAYEPSLKAFEKADAAFRKFCLR